MSVYKIDKDKIHKVIQELERECNDYESESTLKDYSAQDMKGRVPEQVRDIAKEIRRSKKQVIELYRKTIVFLTEFEKKATEFDRQGASKLSVR